MHSHLLFYFVVVCQRILLYAVRMKIDEDRIFVLKKYANATGKKDKKESDHNPIIVDFDINIPSIQKNDKREEFLDLRNTEGLVKFNDITNKSVKLTNSIENDKEDINIQINRQEKRLNKMLHTSFRKVRKRKKKKKNTVLENLFVEKLI